jgi:colicin import membrane protein
VNQLEAQLQAEMQDRSLRNEEISLLLERVTQLDGECATRQGDIAATERLYEELRARTQEAAELQDATRALREAVAVRDAHLVQQAHAHAQAQRAAQDLLVTEQRDAQAAAAAARREVDDARRAAGELEVRVHRLEAARAAEAAAHERAQRALRDDVQDRVESAVAAASQSHAATLRLLEHQAEAEQAAQTARLRAEHASALRGMEAAAEEQLRSTVVSKDRALSNAISTLQESLKFAQEQKSAAALDDIQKRLEAQAAARVR